MSSARREGDDVGDRRAASRRATLVVVDGADKLREGAKVEVITRDGSAGGAAGTPGAGGAGERRRGQRGGKGERPPPGK